MNYNIAHIARWLDVPCLGAPSNNLGCTEVVFDTRKLVNPPNSLFVALAGEIRHGHSFVSKAYELGVRNFIVELSFESQINAYPEATFLVVPSSLQALQIIAVEHRKQFHLPVIGITGSNGKTIVKEWLRDLLNSDFRICNSPRSFNSQLGVAVSVLGIDPSHTLGIFEAGISQSGEMQTLQKMIQPNLTIITHVGSAHDAGFDGRASKIHEKLQLCLGADVVVYPKDIEGLDPEIQQIRKDQPLTKFISWGYSEGATFKLLNVSNQAEGSKIEFNYRGSKHELIIPFSDQASIANAMSCFCALFALERWDQAHINQFQQLKSLDNRLTIEKGRRGNVILNDSYSNDFESLSIALDVIQRQQPNLPLTVILGEMEQVSQSSTDFEQRLSAVLASRNVQEIGYIGQFQLQLSGIPMQYFESTEALMESSWLKSLKNAAVLIKGARKHKLERVVAMLKDRLHKTYLEIDLDAIKFNYLQVKKRIDPQTKLMCMVKAFGYGSGTFEVAKTLQDLGVDYMGVAYADEGVALREAGIICPIMVMNTDAQTMSLLSEYNLEPVIFNEAGIHELKKLHAAQSLTIHLEVDTGMHRLGFEGNSLINALQDLPSSVKIASIFTHLAVSEDPQKDAFTRSQATDFQEIASKVESVIGYSMIKHMSNTGGIFRFPEYAFDMVRLGIGLYGLDPSGRDISDLHTVARLYTTITQIHTVEAGCGIGYGQHDVATHQRKIATIAMGYADGLSRRYGKQVGVVYINGTLAPFVGNICMDMSMVDVTNIPCKEGDSVEIFGNHLSINEMARRGGTISYEILTGISQRVPRIYLGEN